MWQLYILRSLKDDQGYVGTTGDLSARLKQHNTGKVRSTKHRRPFTLVHTESFPTLSVLLFDRLHTLRKLYWRLTKVKTRGVRVVLIRAGQVVLVQHRYGGLWVFPGGKQARTESVEQAAIREVREECNIEVRSFERILGVYNNTRHHKNDTVTVLVSTDWTDHGQKWRLEIGDRRLCDLEELPEGTSEATKLRIAELLSGDSALRTGPWY